MRKILRTLSLHSLIVLSLITIGIGSTAGVHNYNLQADDPCQLSTLYVSSTAAVNGNGTSWASAFQTLKDAIDVASLCPAVTEIRVATGSYYPTGARTTTDRTAALAITRTKLKILGGYDASTGTRNIKINTTTLSGDIGVPADNSDNSYHVMLFSNIPTTDSLIIEGFTITGGNANGSGFRNINNKYIENNSGGGISVNTAGGNVVIRNCLFTANEGAGGGGIQNLNASPLIRNCIFTGNSAGSGGAIRNHDFSSPKITNCLFTANTAAMGGAISNTLNSTPTLLHCTVTANVAQRYGGGMYSGSAFAEPVILNTIIYGNTGVLGDAGITRAYNEAFVPANIGYSLVQGATSDDDQGNISYGGNDLFTNTSQGDYTVKVSSPTINRGHTSIVPEDILTDLAGNIRRQGVVDMGAYEVPLCFVGSTIYVNGAVAISGSGYSWTSAYKTIGEAIELAHQCSNVTEIRVASGTYYPPGSQIVLGPEYSFTITRSNLKILGGYYAATGTRDITANSTILSGDLSGQNSYHVMVLAGIPSADSLIIDGFTITGGNATLGDYTTINGEYIYNDMGGGIQISNASSNTVIRNCIIRNNSSVYGAGGIYNSFSAANFINCVFDANHSDGGGGGLQNGNSTPFIDHCFFQNNTTVYMGAGLYNEGSAPVIMHSKFEGNTAQENGGAMANIFSLPQLSDCMFASNTAAGGGALYNGPGSTSVIFNSEFRGNSGSVNGGAVLNEDATARLTGCLLSGNKSLNNGGGVYNKSGGLTLVNATLSGNSAEIAGALYHSSGTLVITNSLAYGNSSGIIGTGIITYSVLQGLTATSDGNLTGNIDPLFVNAPPSSQAPFTGGDYRLQLCSPLTNAGTADSTGLNLPLMDLARHQRFFADRVDIGAYENVAMEAGIAMTNGSALRIQNKNGTTSYYDNCNGVLASVTTAGGVLDIRGNTTTRIWIDASQPSQYVRRHYEITPENSAAIVRGRVTLYFTQQEFDAFNALNSTKLPVNPIDVEGIKNILIEKRGGTSSDGSGLANTYTGAVQTIDPVDDDVVWNALANRWEISFAVSGFSGFFLKTSTNALPVRWISFSAVQTDMGTALLTWKTQESNVSYYQIERSNNAVNFASIGRVDGKRNGVGMYSFVDPLALSVPTYYRIREFDLDGTSAYSRIVSLSSIKESALSAYPNPVKDFLTVKLGQEHLGTKISIVNTSGDVVSQQIVQELLLKIDLRKPARGIYIVQTFNGRWIKFVKE